MVRRDPDEVSNTVGNNLDLQRMWIMRNAVGLVLVAVAMYRLPYWFAAWAGDHFLRVRSIQTRSRDPRNLCVSQGGGHRHCLKTQLIWFEKWGSITAH